ncbi:hypothetical protein GGX14DRAFT_453126 [Mycena pura]|uniref:Uncharacterized protein n=1 Tax=Mycena pura TaxID=153505 RepID=A0AAD6YAA2_9AGAR|nr:hypothetical protein GGX14DRAFT_453126 [Mycena pura]
MPFFENAKDFKITGGTFNVIHGDLNQYHNHRSTFVAHSYNDNGFPDDSYINDPQGNYPHYGSQPVYDDYAAHRRPRRRHQERGPYGSAEYYYDDNRGRRFQGNHGGYRDYGRYDGSGDYGSYGGRPVDSHGGFEAAMQSPTTHVDLVGGEFTERDMNVTNDYQPTTPGSFNESQDFESMHSTSGSSSLYDHSELEALGNPELAPPTDENATPMGDVDTTASTDASDPADGPTATSVDSLPATQKPRTAVEKMRMKMASMEIMDANEPQAADAAATSPEEKQKANPSFKFGKLFQPRPSNKS